MSKATQCISCKEEIDNPTKAIIWTDGRLKEGQKVYDTYIIHRECFNMKSYKGLHQHIEPGKYD